MLKKTKTCLCGKRPK